MKILQVISDIEEEADGVASAVLGLTRSLESLQIDVGLACAKPINSRWLPKETLFGSLSKSAKWSLNTGLMRVVSKAANSYDIIHNHGLWNDINIVAGFVIPGKMAKLVTSPHGTLTKWALASSKHKKRVVWPLQQRVLSRANLIHVTSESELDDVRRNGFKSPVAVVPIGIDVVSFLKVVKPSSLKKLLFFSRVHPKKGVDRLICAWAKIQNEFPDWRLVIAGKGEEDYISFLKGLAVQQGVDRVEFMGPVYGDEKTKLYFEADIFILPTHSENFGIVVAEALACACPVIVGRGAPWAGVHENLCGWWVENDVGELAATLRIAMGLDSVALHSMGLAGREWMRRDFEWKSVGVKMNESYKWVMGEIDRPSWIVLD